MTLDRPDERVAAAAAHWGARFTANGTDYGDFIATLGRITRWDDWCREWGSTAAGYERLEELQATADYMLARGLATIALAGPYHFDLDWDDLPPQTRATFQVRSGAATQAQARERARLLTLEATAPRITGPLLVVGGGKDRLVTPYHAERLAAQAPGAELVIYPDGSHGVTNHAYESRSLIADWLADHLRG